MRAMAHAAVAGAAAVDLGGSTAVEPSAPAGAPVVTPVPSSDDVVLTQVDPDAVRQEDLEDTIIPVLAEDDAASPEGEDFPAQVQPEPVASAPRRVRTRHDAFEAATRVFASAEPTRPIRTVPEAELAVPVAEEPITEDEAVPYLGTVPRWSRSNFQRLAAGASTVGVMAIVGVFAVSMSLTAAPTARVQQAVDYSTVVTASEADPDASAAAQNFVVPSDVQNADIERSQNYAAASAAELAHENGIANYSDALFTNDASAPIQWPFVVGTTMSYGYGMRDGVLHEGIDFTPGSGAEVQAIADGTVRIATEDGGAYGVTVYIDHEIDGQVITSHYAHMQYGSLRVQAGETVTVGTVIGLVGDTGRSFGAHLHFELILNGSTFDPLPWLAEHAGGYHGG